MTREPNRTSSVKRDEIVNFSKNSSFKYKHKVIDNTAGPSHQRRNVMNYLFDDTDCKYFIIVVEI